MTISTTSSAVLVQGNGATTVFNYGFIIPYQADGATPAVTVYFIDASGNVTTLAPNTYTVAGIGNPSGGTVTYPLAGSPIAAGTQLYIQRSLAYTQPAQFLNNSFYPKTVENALDSTEMQIQQLNTGLSRAINAPLGETGIVFPAKPGRDNNIMEFDVNGVPIAVRSYSSIISAAVAAAIAAVEGGAAVTNPQFTNAITYGADPTGSVDSCVAFQAAIDASYTTTRNTWAPIGSYNIDNFTHGPIYLDAPNNLRRNPRNPATEPQTPTQFGFTLQLQGQGGMQGEPSFSTQLTPTDKTTPVVVVGPGQGMLVSKISVFAAVNLYPKLDFSENGIGIAISGGNGGASRTLIENCAVNGRSYGYKIGYNQDFLGDSNTFRNCFATNCTVGISITQTQNYINSIEDCTMGYNKTNISNLTAKAVQIKGGNLSCPNAPYRTYAITGVGNFTHDALSPQGGGRLGFNATVTNGESTAGGYGFQAKLSAGYMDHFCVQTAHYGLVPCTLAAYNAGTLLGTFAVDPDWLAMYWGAQDPTILCDITTELAACTALYAVDMHTHCAGSGFHIDGAHYENPLAATCYLDLTNTFNSDVTNSVKNLFCNSDPAKQDLPLSGDTLSLYYCTAVWPFIKQRYPSTLPLSIDGLCAPMTGLSPVVIQIYQPGGFVFSHSTGFSFVTRHPAGNVPYFVPDYFERESKVFGFGTYDRNYFMPYGSLLAQDVDYSERALMELTGYFPKRGQVPTMSSAAYTAALAHSGALGANYPMVCGYRVYKIEDYDGPSGTTRLVRSKHHGWSWGQDITGNWNAKGGSPFVNITTPAAINRLQLGSVVGLDPGSGVVYYAVIYIQQFMGIIGIVPLGSGTANGGFTGTKGTTYSGTVIKQEPFAFETIG